MMDAEGTAEGSDAEESQRGRLTAEKLPRLARVSFSGMGGDSGELWDVIELPHLRFLKISLSRLGVDDSGEHFLQRLHLLTQLEALEIESCEVGSRLVRWKELRNLRVLSLWGTTFDTKTSGTEPDLVRETLRQIGSLPRLEKLRLTGKSVDDGGVAQIAGLSSLRSLELYDNGITAAAGRSLARLHGLRFLDISRPNADLQPPLTDAILKDLALLPELEELNMQGRASK